MTIRYDGCKSNKNDMRVFEKIKYDFNFEQILC